MFLSNPRIRLACAFTLHLVLFTFWAYVLLHPDNDVDRVLGVVFMCLEALIIGVGIRKRLK